jgi:hypothetical protein
MGGSKIIFYTVSRYILILDLDPHSVLDPNTGSRDSGSAEKHGSCEGMLRQNKKNRSANYAKKLPRDLTELDQAY